MPMPGSAGERALQERFGTAQRARGFYDSQLLDRLNPAMREFIGRQEMMWVATADAHGDCDCTFRAGPIGFVGAVDDRRVAYPEYRGNGVLASLGNITENAHIGLLFLDFFDSTVGLHINGRARILENAELLRDEKVEDEAWVALFAAGGQYAERWVMVDVDEAYIHCAKHVPLLAKREKHIDWGTDDVAKKGGDAFGAKAEARRWTWDSPVSSPLRAAPLLAGCTDDEIRAVAEIADEVVFETGHELVRQGEPVARFLVLLAGRAEVRKGRRVVNEVRSGDFIGEIGLVSRSPATATVTALEPVRALAVTTLAFRALLRRVPSLTDRVLEALAARTLR
jgi:predicted pyridoxine 5'-phosphate oxidase superfamily flavin-nucleotide-binding protein